MASSPGRLAKHMPMCTLIDSRILGVPMGVLTVICNILLGALVKSGVCGGFHIHSNQTEGILGVSSGLNHFSWTFFHILATCIMGTMHNRCETELMVTSYLPNFLWIMSRSLLHVSTLLISAIKSANVVCLRVLYRLYYSFMLAPFAERWRSA